MSSCWRDSASPPSSSQFQECSLCYEANARYQDPVGGAYAVVKAQEQTIAAFTAQIHMLQGQWPPVAGGGFGMGPPVAGGGWGLLWWVMDDARSSGVRCRRLGASPSSWRRRKW